MAEVVDAGAGPGLVGADAVAGRRGKAESRCGHGVWVGFECHYGQAVGEAEEGADYSSQRVTGKPDVRVWVSFRDVMVQIASRKVIMALLPQALDQAGRVASVRVGHAIADLLPAVRSSLATATRAEQIVVQLIITSSLCAIKDGHGCTLQAYDNSPVILVRKDVAAQAILLPAKVFGIVESTSHLLPLSRASLVRICVVCHLGKTDDRLFVCNVRTRHLILRPGC